MNRLIPILNEYKQHKILYMYFIYCPLHQHLINIPVRHIYSPICLIKHHSLFYFTIIREFFKPDICYNTSKRKGNMLDQKYRSRSP